MRIVIQRVKSASVRVEGVTEGAIEKGLLLFVGVHQNDMEEHCTWCAEKIVKLRIFEDEEGKMNRSLTDIEGGLLVVSQFTLYGNIKKGTRPSFTEAAHPEMAETLYQFFIHKLKEKGVMVESGVFGAMMEVELINDGPVTLILER